MDQNTEQVSQRTWWYEIRVELFPPRLNEREIKVMTFTRKGLKRIKEHLKEEALSVGKAFDEDAELDVEMLEQHFEEYSNKNAINAGVKYNFDINEIIKLFGTGPDNTANGIKETFAEFTSVYEFDGGFIIHKF